MSQLEDIFSKEPDYSWQVRHDLHLFSNLKGSVSDEDTCSQAQRPIQLHIFLFFRHFLSLPSFPF